MCIYIHMQISMYDACARTASVPGLLGNRLRTHSMFRSLAVHAAISHGQSLEATRPGPADKDRTA